MSLKAPPICDVTTVRPRVANAGQDHELRPSALGDVNGRDALALVVALGLGAGMLLRAGGPLNVQAPTSSLLSFASTSLMPTPSAASGRPEQGGRDDPARAACPGQRRDRRPVLRRCPDPRPRHPGPRSRTRHALQPLRRRNRDAAVALRADPSSRSLRTSAHTPLSDPGVQRERRLVTRPGRHLVHMSSSCCAARKLSGESELHTTVTAVLRSGLTLKVLWNPSQSPRCTRLLSGRSTIPAP